MQRVFKRALIELSGTWSQYTLILVFSSVNRLSFHVEQEDYFLLGCTHLTLWENIQLQTHSIEAGSERHLGKPPSQRAAYLTCQSVGWYVLFNRLRMNEWQQDKWGEEWAEGGLHLQWLNSGSRDLQNCRITGYFQKAEINRRPSWPLTTITEADLRPAIWT